MPIARPALRVHLRRLPCVVMMPSAKDGKRHDLLFHIISDFSIIR
jgi:hypothetical protein